MHCLKCGRELGENRTFCPTCLSEMAKNPVDPSAMILLPRRRTENTSRKPSSRKVITPEEQVVRLLRRVRILTVMLAAAIVLCAALTAVSYHYIRIHLANSEVRGSRSVIAADFTEEPTEESVGETTVEATEE